MTKGDLKLFNEKTGQYIDALYAVLVASDEMQFFPEMLEIFGKESTVSFLDIFAGQTITVPPRDVVELKIRNISMWMTYTEHGDDVIPALAKKHDITEDSVRSSIEGIAECLSKVGVVSCRPAKSAENNSGL